MTPSEHNDAQHRVLVLAPTGRDAANSAAVLQKARIPSFVCRGVTELCSAIETGAGAVILTEEALALDRASCIVEELRKQPAWSDLPILLLTRGGPESKVALRATTTLGNVVLLERPVRVLTLVTSVRAALRARSRQYDLRENLHRLRDADRRKDEFLAMLAHELRNPLAPMRNALAIMQTKGATPETVARATQITDRQVVHMTRLIDDLLDVSRVTRGKIALKRERLDLGATLTGIGETVLPFMTARSQEFRLTLPGTPLPVNADPARVEQVFVNLITNAAKFTPPGGRVEVSAEEDAGSAVVRVRDTGIGIDATLLPRMFDLFVQAEQGFDRSQGGLGIGLTLVKVLVEMHGGTVSASSGGAGRGSEFVVRLPLVQPATVAETKVVDGVSTATVAQRILVVDDNADAAESLAMMLRLSGHDVVTAEDGVSALALARTFGPDVIFLDIGLPGMNGYEVARRLRQDLPHSPMVLVAVTGYGQEEDRRRSKAVGFDHHLVKPADVAAVHALLAASRSDGPVGERQ